MNPKWEPQLLIDVDLAKDLKEEVLLLNGEGEVLHTQRVVYRNLPNVCFKCLQQGHLIKECPDLEKGKKFDD